MPDKIVLQIQEIKPEILEAIYAKKQEIVTSCKEFRFQSKYYEDPVMAVISEFSEVLTNFLMANMLTPKQCVVLMLELQDQLCERAFETFGKPVEVKHMRVIEQLFR